MKILFCHDGTERGHEALERAVNHFEGRKPDMILLCVSDSVGDASMELDAISEEYEKEHKEVLRRSAGWVTSKGLEVDVMLASGDPRKMITQAIEKKNPDIVVIARREKSTIESVFRKSVSAYLVKNASCHLFIMGPE